jgi:N-glycosylase/DNA lyase
MPGVPWGQPDVLFTPAYWQFQATLSARNACATDHRLGASLKSECVACLLGGHGIPAEVGLAAFRAIMKSGLIERSNVDREEVFDILRQPLLISSSRTVRYRFANSKSTCIAELLNCFEEPATNDCVAIRNWLTRFRGIGLKTASWIVRNWYNSDDVAILDIHIHRAGLLAGIFDGGLTIARDYLRLERQFLDFAIAIGIRASVLDALIWQQMKKAGRLVHRILPC